MNIIIIPYRNRKEHLEYFLKNSVPIFEKYLKPYKIVVVEQGDSQLFNRGKLLNIGICENWNPDNYYFLHDVDTNPTDLCVKENYTKDASNTIIGLYNIGNYDTLGGVIKIKGSHFKEMNGFPNDLFGWGCEDKALKNRADFFKKNVVKNVLTTDNNIPTYFYIFNDNHVRIPSPNTTNITNFEYSKFPTLFRHDKSRHIYSSGLNNIKYNIISKNIENNIEYIKVNL
jgi:hypothetical protein